MRWEAFVTWGINRRGWQPETCGYYHRRIDQAARWLQLHHHTDPEQATTRQLQAWLDSAPPSPKTRNTYRAALVAFYDWLTTTGFRTDNPARKIDRVREKPPVPRALDPDVAVQVMEAASQGHRRDVDAAVHLMFLGGLRVGEVAGLQWADVEGDWLRVTGKGDKTRMVPIHRDLSAALRGWYGACPSTGWVFPSSRRPGRPVAAQTVRKQVQALAASVGVSMVPHQARHSSATRLMECGADVPTVAGFLGHASLQTTGVYLRVRPVRLAEAVGALSYREPVTVGG